MSVQLQIYAFALSTTGGASSLEPGFNAASDTLFKQDYTAMTSVSLGNSAYLVGINNASQTADLYALLDAAPWIRFAATVTVGTGWDSVDTFLLGNQLHLLLYQRQKGLFNLIALDSQLASTGQLTYYRNHDPGVTAGFTTIKSFELSGGVVVLGYDFDTGSVAMYTIAVTATSPPGTAPLMGTNVWAHQWARGWTRFAFFQLGGENFFLKTNTPVPNVNIDHVLDNPADGTAEVATKMDLTDAQQLSIVHPFLLPFSAPGFIAYKPDGTTTLYSIHSDCRGWTPLSCSQTLPNASQIAPYQVNGQQFFLFTVAGGANG